MPAFSPFSVMTDKPDVNTGWTFKPYLRKDGVFTYMDRDRYDQLELSPTLTLSTTGPTKTSKLMKVRAKVSLPVTADDVSTGGFKLAHTLTADITFIIPPMSTAASRETLLDIMEKLLNAAPLTTILGNGEPLY